MLQIYKVMFIVNSLTHYFSVLCLKHFSHTMSEESSVLTMQKKLYKMSDLM